MKYKITMRTWIDTYTVEVPFIEDIPRELEALMHRAHGTIESINIEGVTAASTPCPTCGLYRCVHTELAM